MRDLLGGVPVDDILAPYAAVDRRRAKGRSWVVANMVAGLDGSVSVGGRVGALSDGLDAELFRRMRSLADVVLVGAETVRRERYGPVRVDDPAPGATPPPIAVVTRSGDLDVSIPMFAEATETHRPIVLTGTTADPGHVAALEAVAEVVVAGTDGVEPGLALAELARRGHQVVLCEGGPRLLGDFIAAGLLDELCLTLTPVMGGDNLPVAITPDGIDLVSFDLVGVVAAGNTLFLRYERTTDKDGAR